MNEFRFRLVDEGVSVRLSGIEASFLRDAIELLEGMGTAEDDPGAARLNPPVYLGDHEADVEWRRLAGGELQTSRRADRSAFELVLDAIDKAGAEGIEMAEVVISDLEAAAILRVLNEVRLVLAARWGVDTAEDFDDLRPEADDVLSFLGWLVTDLADVLGEALDAR